MKNDNNEVSRDWTLCLAGVFTMGVILLVVGLNGINEALDACSCISTSVQPHE